MNDFHIGQLVYARVNEGRGVKVVRLVSRHDPDYWDVDPYPDTDADVLWLVREDDLLTYDPYGEPKGVEL